MGSRVGGEWGWRRGSGCGLPRLAMKEGGNKNSMSGG